MILSSFSIHLFLYSSLQSEDGLRRFQAGDLSPNDEQWYLLAPPEARQVLSKQEITRQSIIFELIQNERDYVRDLELLSEAFIDPLRNIKPMASAKVESFIEEVFSNLNNIKEHHEIMIAALFARQRDQHPLVTSIADIILDRPSFPPMLLELSSNFILQAYSILRQITKPTLKTTHSQKPNISPNTNVTPATNSSSLNVLKTPV